MQGAEKQLTGLLVLDAWKKRASHFGLKQKSPSLAERAKFVLIKKLFWEVSQTKCFNFFLGETSYFYMIHIFQRFCLLSFHTTFFFVQIFTVCRWWDGWENPSHGINTGGGRAIVWLNLFAQEIQGSCAWGWKFRGENHVIYRYLCLSRLRESPTKRNCLL